MTREHILTEVLGAVEVGNSRKVNTLLSCRAHLTVATLGAKLQPSTEQAQNLLDTFLSLVPSKCSKSTENNSLNVSASQVFRALLMIHPTYTTPWSAIEQLAEVFWKLPTYEVTICVSALEIFFQDVLSKIKSNSIEGLQSDVTSDCGALLVRAVRTVSGQQLLGDGANKGERHGVSLLTAMITFARGFSDEACLLKIRVAIFGRKPTGQKSVIRWMKLVQELMWFANAKDLLEVNATILSIVYDSEQNLSVDALQEIFTTAFHLVRLVAGNSSTHSAIQRLPLNILLSTKESPAGFYLLRSHLTSLLESLSLTELSLYWQYFCGEMNSKEIKQPCPDSVLASVCLTFLEATMSSEVTMVSRMVSEALAEPANESNSLLVEVRVQILDLLFPTLEMDKSSCQSFAAVCSDLTLIVDSFDGIMYCGKGTFVDQDGIAVDFLSHAGTLVHDAILLSDTNSTFEAAKHGARQWVAAAESILRPDDSSLYGRVMLAYIIILSTVYFDFPSQQEAVVRSLRKFIQNPSTESIQRHCSIAAVTLIARSRKEHSDPELFNPMCQLLQDPLDNQTFDHIASCMSSVPSARPTILHRSKTLLYHSFGWLGKAESTPGNSTQSGLLGLLELLRISTWDQYALEAWNILSEIMVADSPRISLSDRLWLYEQITDLIENDEVPLSTSMHFLRAAISRGGILFFPETLEESLRFLPENSFLMWPDHTGNGASFEQLENPVKLFQLIIDLTGGELGIPLSFEGVHTTGHEVLLQCILNRRNCDDTSKSKRHEKFLQMWLSSALQSESIASAPCHRAVIFYLSAILDYLTESNLSSKNVISKKSTRCLQSLGDILGAIKMEEREAVEAKCLVIGLTSVLPTWTQNSTTFEPPMLFGVEYLPGRWEMIQSSLYDLLIKVACWGESYTEKPTDRARDMVLAVGYLLEVKQQFLLKNINKKESTLHLDTCEGMSYLLENNTIANTGANFFLAASKAIHELVLQGSSLQEAEEILSAVMLYCEALDEVPIDSEIEVWPTLLQAIWKLYRNVGCEKGAVRFVEYLESAPRTQPARPTRADTSICSLHSFQNSEDVDIVTREIRLHIVNALWKCLQFAGNPSISSDIGPQARAETTITAAYCKSSDIDMTFIGNLITSLAQDLRTGLEGQSGGITTEMFEAFIQSIQECTLFIFGLAKSSKVETSSTMAGCLSNVATIICDILVSFPLEDAILFRSTLILATAELPSTLREIMRWNLSHSDSNNSKDQGIISPEEGLIDSLFHDCHTILTQWSSLRDPNSVPWEDMIGKSLLNEHAHSPNDFSRQDRTSDGRRASNAPHATKSNRHDETVIITRRIKLRTKEVWSWALSCTFVAFEEKWLESLRSTASDDKKLHPEIHESALPRTLDFLASRQKDLLSCLKNVAKMFNSSTGTINQSTILEMSAMNLPSAPRIRLCHVIATTSKVLKYSINQLCSYLDPQTRKNGHGLRKIAFLEPLCCVSAWLVFDSRDTDISTGTFRWLAMLHRKSPPGEQPSKSMELQELVSWVSQAASLVRDLCVNLRKLDHTCRRISYELGESSTIFQKFFGGGGLQEMLRLTARKLKLLEQSISPEYKARSLPDFPTLTGDESGGKKRVRRNGSNSRQRKRLATGRTMSRNRIVNAFNLMDQKTGEVTVDGDAFVDLEDFLVEG